MNGYKFKLNVDPSLRERSRKASEELLKNAAGSDGGTGAGAPAAPPPSAPGFFDDKQGLLSALIGAGTGALAGLGIDTLRPVDDEEDSRKRRLKTMLTTSLLGAGAAYGLHSMDDTFGDQSGGKKPPLKRLSNGWGLFKALHPKLTAGGATTMFLTGNDRSWPVIKGLLGGLVPGWGWRRNPTGNLITRNIPLPFAGSGRIRMDTFERLGVRPSWMRMPDAGNVYLSHLSPEFLKAFRGSNATSADLWASSLLTDQNSLKALRDAGVFDRHTIRLPSTSYRGGEAVVIRPINSKPNAPLGLFKDVPGGGSQLTPLEVQRIIPQLERDVGNARFLLSDAITGRGSGSWFSRNFRGFRPGGSGVGGAGPTIRRWLSRGGVYAMLALQLLESIYGGEKPYTDEE